METLNILQKYHIDNKNNVLNSDYTWSNTPDRTNFNLNQSIERFNTKELIHAISSMLENKLIKDNFTVMDLFGGTGAITYIIKKSFPKCIPICIDLKYHNTWKEIRNEYSDFNFFQINYFKLEKEIIPLNLDLIITFNTFRGWDNEVGPFVNQNYSKQQFCNWVKNNANYFITDRGDVENHFKLLPFDFPFNNLKVAYTK
tara:strand:- start:338 stop:937 length:600 start_codon:yes stop_codon:yes gene_type:complete